MSIVLNFHKKTVHAPPHTLLLSLFLVEHEKVSKEVEHEALMTLGHAALMRSDCEQALSFYERVETPSSAWNQTQVREGEEVLGE